MKTKSIVKSILSLLLAAPFSALAQSSGLIGAGEKLTQQLGLWGFLIFIVILGLVLYNKFKDNQK